METNLKIIPGSSKILFPMIYMQLFLIPIFLILIGYGESTIYWYVDNSNNTYNNNFWSFVTGMSFKHDSLEDILESLLLLINPLYSIAYVGSILALMVLIISQAKTIRRIIIGLIILQIGIVGIDLIFKSALNNSNVVRIIRPKQHLLLHLHNSHKTHLHRRTRNHYSHNPE